MKPSDNLTSVFFQTMLRHFLHLCPLILQFKTGNLFLHRSMYTLSTEWTVSSVSYMFQLSLIDQMCKLILLLPLNVRSQMHINKTLLGKK